MTKIQSVADCSSHTVVLRDPAKMVVAIVSPPFSEDRGLIHAFIRAELKPFSRTAAVRETFRSRTQYEIANK